MWFRVDDKLWGSPKWLAIKAGARALWVTAGAWSMDQLTDGHIPAHVVPILGGRPSDAKQLVASGLWVEVEGGYRFHDWTDYQPDADSIRAKRDAESEGGRRGNHDRWHSKRGVRVDGCEFCASEPPSGTRSGTRSGNGRDTRIGGESSRTQSHTHKTVPNGTGAKTPATPADEIAAAVYEATSKMVKYIAVRNIAAKALDTGATPERIKAAMLDLYNRNKPITLETVGQTLKVARPTQRKAVVDQWLA